jgi:hypothetical protein
MYGAFWNILYLEMNFPFSNDKSAVPLTIHLQNTHGAQQWEITESKL